MVHVEGGLEYAMCAVLIDWELNNKSRVLISRKSSWAVFTNYSKTTGVRSVCSSFFIFPHQMNLSFMIPSRKWNMAHDQWKRNSDHRLRWPGSSSRPCHNYVTIVVHVAKQPFRDCEKVDFDERNAKQLQIAYLSYSWGSMNELWLMVFFGSVLELWNKIPFVNSHESWSTCGLWWCGDMDINTLNKTTKKFWMVEELGVRARWVG